MNDKNFIEELKQKREEYGVTQRKLALAIHNNIPFFCNCFKVEIVFLDGSFPPIFSKVPSTSKKAILIIIFS